MKTFYISIVALLLGNAAWTQVDRTKAPEPGPAAKIQLKNAETFTLKNGLKVFVVENHKIPKVSYSLVLDIDPVMEKEKKGYVDMVGEMMTRGTITRTKEQLDKEVDFIGATLSAGSTGLYASALKKHNDKLLELMADVLLNPSFPADELEKLKTQSLSALETEKKEPNSIITNIRQAWMYGKNHPYSEVTTEETIGNIAIDDIKNYYKANFMPNVGYLAIVGDITKAEAQALCEKYFSSWAKGKPEKRTYTMPTPPANPQIIMHNREESVQSTIRFVYPLQYTPGSPDAIKLSLLASIMGGGSTGRLYKNLRETHGYTYGAYCSFIPNKLVGYYSAGADVRNSVTDSAVYEFIVELNKIRNERVTSDELQDTKKEIEGGFARSLEDPRTIANFAINIERYKLPKDYYQNYLVNLNAVSVDDIYYTAQNYIQPYNYYLLVVGNRDSVEAGLLKYDTDQKITFVDNYGAVVTNQLMPVPDGVTIETVMESYINAIGGKEKLEAVKDYKITANGSIQGFPIENVVIYKAPGKAYFEVKAGGNVMSLQSTDGTTGKKNDAQTGKGTLTKSEITELQAQMDLMFEVNYAKYGYKAELKGIEPIKGKKYYLVEFTDPEGNTSKQYFDVNTGLKKKSISYNKTPQGMQVVTTELDSYSPVSGILFPHQNKTDFGGGVVIISNVASITVNGDISDDIFK